MGGWFFRTKPVQHALAELVELQSESSWVQSPQKIWLVANIFEKFERLNLVKLNC